MLRWQVEVFVLCDSQSKIIKTKVRVPGLEFRNFGIVDLQGRKVQEMRIQKPYMTIPLVTVSGLLVRACPILYDLNEEFGLLVTMRVSSLGPIN